MKGLRIGRRRGRDSDAALSPLELALRPALVDGRWQVPDRFNFTRDVVEALARDPKRRALTLISSEGIIEPRTFLELSEGASHWAVTLREQSVAPSDRVVVMAGTTVDWLEAVLGIWKIGGVVVPCTPSTTAPQLERIVSSTDAALVIAERGMEPTIERMGFTPDVHFFEDGATRSSKDAPTGVPTHDTASRDLAFVVSTTGVGGEARDVAHTHGAIFATRVQAEHWLDVGRGDTVWCTADSASPLTMWNTVAGPWSRGAEIALQHGEFDVDERLDLIYRLGASIVCQSPAEYRALASHRKLERYRSPRLRRLVSTGDYLDPEVTAVLEERWGLSIADGYGQAETNVIVANLADGAATPGSLGRAMPGHHVAVIDDQGNELPPGVDGDLAVRGRPPTLFAGYWELPEETKSAFLGDWYLTGDVAHVDEDGCFTFVARAEDLITSSAGMFGPYDVERALGSHPAITATAVVGIRDLQRGGHFVRAYVVPWRPDAASEQLEAELKEYVGQTLPAQQVPREIVFVEELPRMGWKVSRHELRERPMPMRPLWDAPEGESEPAARAAPVDAEFSPRIEPEPQPEPPAATVAIPEIVVPAVEPLVVSPPTDEVTVGSAPLAADETEPFVVEMTPIFDTPPAPEDEPRALPVAEALRVHEPAPEPEAEPHVEEAPPEPLAEPEPAALVAEPELEPTPEPEPMRESESELLPMRESEPEPEPEPALEVKLEPEPTRSDPSDDDAPATMPVAAESDATPQLTVVEPHVDEPEELPDFIVEASTEAPPLVRPEPEPEPDLSAPLPEYLVEPDTNGAPVIPLPPPTVESDEEEEDLGPLPDYVIDPSDPEAARKQVPPPPPEPKPILAPREKGPAEADEPAPPSLSFPSAASFTLPSASAGAVEQRESRAPRPRPQHDTRKGKRAEPAEPADEANEVSWMAGLSNRLSAYSLSEGEEPAPQDPVDES